jgi:glycerol kinase
MGAHLATTLLMQFQADVLGVPVVRPKVTETTALGAAYLAGLAVGYWESEQEIVQLWQMDKRFEPTISTDHRQALRDAWRRAVSQARHG